MPKVPDKLLIPELNQLTTLETTSRVLMAAVKTAHIKLNSLFHSGRRNDLC